MHLKWNLPSDTSVHSDSSVSNPIPKLTSLHPRHCSAASLTPSGNSQEEAMWRLHCKLGLEIYCKGGGWKDLNSVRRKQLVQIQSKLTLALRCQLAHALAATLSTASIFLEVLLWILFQALKCSWMFISIMIHWKEEALFSSYIICYKSKVTWPVFFTCTHTLAIRHVRTCAYTGT